MHCLEVLKFLLLFILQRKDNKENASGEKVYYFLVLNISMPENQCYDFKITSPNTDPNHYPKNCILKYHVTMKSPL